MKIIYKDLSNLFEERPSKMAISDKLFQLGHEHEIVDDIFELELTPNRGDCFSLNGIARDLNVFFKRDKTFEIFNEEIADLQIDFENRAPKKCPKISFLEIEIENTTDKYKCYLENYFQKLGLNKVNFFTDISNYLSYEQGQPTHCYDANKINDKIILEEKELDYDFKTLFNSKINLRNKNLVFTMGDNIINLAGVMGGLSTACSTKTKKVLVECAFFEPEAIIGKSIKNNIVSDAAHKFERGVDILSHNFVLRRFINIVSEHVNILSVKLKTFEFSSFRNTEIDINLEHISRILGTDINEEKYFKYLQNLGFEFKNTMHVPSYRHDICTQNDIAEEIARVEGYNNIKASPFKLDLDYQKNTEDIHNILRNFMSNLGFNEVINFPFTSIKNKNSIRLDNPIDANKNFMRTDLRESLINNLLYNERRQKDSLKLYEITDIYSNKNTITRDARIGIIASGRQGEDYKSFTKKIDKGFLINNFKSLNCDFEEINRGDLDSKIKDNIFYTEIMLEDIPKEFFEDKERFKTNKDIVFRTYIPISEFPTSIRDISFSISDISKVEYVINYFNNIDDDSLKKVFMFDFYKNKKRGEVKIGYRFIFQSQTKTLIDEDVNTALSQLISPITKIQGIEVPGM